MDFDSFLAKSFYGRVDGTGAAQSGQNQQFASQIHNARNPA